MYRTDTSTHKMFKTYYFVIYCMCGGEAKKAKAKNKFNTKYIIYDVYT